MKRMLLFLGTNLLVILTISIITSALGLHGYLTKYGLDYKSLAIFCAIWGTTGAFISLFLSKSIAKMAMGVVIINPNHANRDERALLDIIYRLAHKAGLKTMPEVGIYGSQEVNAFATGPSKNNALVAVSSGLLANMNQREVEGVLGHEISHIANGDMVTMTLIQGIVNAFAMFLSRIIAYGISVALSRDQDKEGGISTATYYILTILFDILFTFLGAILVAAYSRWREYRADLGGAQLSSRDNMIASLQRLQSMSSLGSDQRAPSLAALKISSQSRWLAVFSSHPSLEARIERLQKSHQM